MIRLLLVIAFALAANACVVQTSLGLYDCTWEAQTGLSCAPVAHRALP